MQRRLPPCCCHICCINQTPFPCSVFGPSAKAAQLEGSKSFLKALCAKYDIPTAASRSFRDAGAAKDYIRQQVAGPDNSLLRLPLFCICMYGSGLLMQHRLAS
jgi:Phosphoribosylglycinamide synthetase, ATP-grasp (A) domain